MLVHILIVGLLVASVSQEDVNFSERYEVDFSFAAYYQDSMVLQAEPRNAIIWGYGEIGATVEISLNVHIKYVTGVTKTVDGRGVWSVTIDPQSQGTKAVISGSHLYRGMEHVIRISDVIFGDVWFCSGQSNMFFPLGYVFNATEELEKVAEYPDIRIFKVAQVASEKPLFDLQEIQQEWTSPSPEIAQYFSAVCLLYGRYLYDKLKKPIGLISSTWGGTPIEVWSSPQALSSCVLDSRKDLEYSPEEELPPEEDSVLWNSMIHPFVNMTIKGVIWDQGERNAHFNRDSYNCTFPAMIRDWREAWYTGTNHETEREFPFGFVQLGTTEGDSNTFPITRWHQTADFGYVPNLRMPNTFMAVTLDLPDPTSPHQPVHTRDKQDVSHRLSKAALSSVYKYEMTDPAPIPVEAVLIAEGIFVKYDLPNLKVLNDKNFQICCSSSICDVSDISKEEEWLDAPIVDYDIQSILLGNISVCNNNIKMIRYGWATVPCEFKQCSVYNQQDLPAPPFVLEVKSK